MNALDDTAIPKSIFFSEQIEKVVKLGAIGQLKSILRYDFKVVHISSSSYYRVKVYIADVIYGWSSNYTLI